MNESPSTMLGVERQKWPPFVWLAACGTVAITVGTHVSPRISNGASALYASGLTLLAEGILIASAAMGWRCLRRDEASILVPGLLALAPFVVGAIVGPAFLASIVTQTGGLSAQAVLKGMALQLGIKLAAPLVDIGAFDSSMLVMLVAGLAVLRASSRPRKGAQSSEFSFPAFGCALIAFVGVVYLFLDSREEEGAVYPFATSALFGVALPMAPLLAAAIRDVDDEDVTSDARAFARAVPGLAIVSSLLIQVAAIFTSVGEISWIDRDSVDSPPSWPGYWLGLLLLRVLPAAFAFGMPLVLVRSRAHAVPRRYAGVLAFVVALVVALGTYLHADYAFDEAQTRLYDLRASAKGEPRRTR